MFSENHGLLEWNQDFILNKSHYISKNIIYKESKNNVFIFNNETFSKGYKQNIYKFIIDKFILENDVNGGVCYFCEFIFFKETGGIIKSEYEEHGLCSDCVNLWNISINMIQKINNLFIVNDFRNNRITVNIVDTRKTDEITIYYRIIVPTNRFCYKTISEFIIDDDQCNLCYSCLNYEDNDVCFKSQKYICSKCLDYSKKLLVDNNYYKYLIMINTTMLHEIKSIIINYLVLSLI